MKSKHFVNNDGRGEIIENKIHIDYLFPNIYQTFYCTWVNTV